MDSISGTMANLHSTDPLKPEMPGVERSPSQLKPQHLDHQLNEGLNDDVSKDCSEIRSLHDYNVQTVTPENSVDESGISLAKELETLLVQGEAETANIKLAEAINKNLTLEGLISDNDLHEYLVQCLSGAISEQYSWFDQPPFQTLIENLVKLGIDPKAALHQTFMFFTSVKILKWFNGVGKNLERHLNDAESATGVKFRDLIKSHTHQQLCLTLKKDKNLDLFDARQYLKLLEKIKIEPDKQLLASELQAWLADAIHQKCIWLMIDIIGMDKQWELGLQIDTILVPEVKADLENYLHAQLKTAMEIKDFDGIIELVGLANSLGLNYKNDDLKQPMTDSLFAAVGGSGRLSRLLEIAKTLGLNPDKIIPELKEQYPSVFCTHLKEYLGLPSVIKVFNSWFQEIKLHGIDLHGNREALDSFIFNELHVHLVENLKEYEETVLPPVDRLFSGFLYHFPYGQIKTNAALLEIDFSQSEIKDKIFDLCRQMIFKHYHDYNTSSSQVH